VKRRDLERGRGGNARKRARKRAKTR